MCIGDLAMSNMLTIELGGCGAMYRVNVASKIFQGKSIVQQHKMVNDTLAEEMKKMHGLTITTKVLS
jgi:stress-induced morphogen